MPKDCRAEAVTHISCLQPSAAPGMKAPKYQGNTLLSQEEQHPSAMEGLIIKPIQVSFLKTVGRFTPAIIAVNAN